MTRLIAKHSKRSLSLSDKISFFCVFGREGVTDAKIEGDWKTPAGSFKIRKIYYRADRIPKIDSQIECIAINKNDGWCDDQNKDEYNTLIKLPIEGSYENLWREDELYDVIVVLGYNDSPAIKGRGSAIFLHIAKEGMQYTQGCLALKKEDLRSLVAEISQDSEITISL